MGEPQVGADDLSKLGDDITGWFDKIGPDYAKWLGVPYQPVPRDYGQMLVEVCYEFKSLLGKPIDPLGKAAQIAHETAGGQSQFFRERKNPSGLGAVNDAPNQALWFGSHREGLQASAAHTLNYTVKGGDRPWQPQPGKRDPRYPVMQQKGLLGTVVTFADYEQKWAWTDPAKYVATPPEQRYGGRIAALAEDARIWISTQSNDRPKVERPPIQDCMISTAHAGRPGLPLDYEWVTIHDTGNRAFGAGEDAHCRYLQSGAGGRTVGWHLTVGDTDVLQHVPLDEVAWHAGDGYYGTGNRKSVAVEMTVDSGQDFEKAYRNLVWVAAWLLDRKGLGVDRLVQHNHWKSEQYPEGKHCPAWLREEGKWGQFVKDVQARMAQVGDPQNPVVKDPNARYFPETGFWVVNLREARMLDHWEAFGGLEEPDPVGYPRGGMVLDEDGVYRQLFDNKMLGVYPGGNARSEAVGRRYAELLKKVGGD